MVRQLWIEVNLKGLRTNYGILKNYLGRNIKVLAAIKQAAYGHGLIPVARELSRAGADVFGVGSIEEAVSLRESGFNEPILVLTAVLPRFAHFFLTYRIIPAVVDLQFARALNEEAKRRGVVIPVHIKIDTGMGRLGTHYTESDEFIEKLLKYKNLLLEGIFTHFPVADIDPEFTNHQITVFNELIERMSARGITFRFRHCANSVGLVQYPQAHFNMVRPGLLLYGIKAVSSIDLAVEPILSLRSRVVYLKKIKRGMGVSYGRNFIAKKSLTIGTVAVGYADGYPWSLSKYSRVIIKDAYCKLAGNVCMDHIMVDLGARRDVKVGDEVILIGKKKDLEITTEELALWADTIPYEIVSRLSLKIPRLYKFPTKT